jgi:hypothetical protein
MTYKCSIYAEKVWKVVSTDEYAKRAIEIFVDDKLRCDLKNM